MSRALRAHFLVRRQVEEPAVTGAIVAPLMILIGHGEGECIEGQKRSDFMKELTFGLAPAGWTKCLQAKGHSRLSMCMQHKPD